MATSEACEPTGCEVLKEGPIIIKKGGKQIKLVLTTNGLTLNDATADVNKKNKGLDLLWCDVIAASAKQLKGSDAGKDFIIHYMELQANKKLQCKCIDVASVEQPADTWIDIIQNQCASVKNRPKRLFVLVNPIGGAGSGQQTYEKKVRPIFEMAQIHADVQITDSAKHGLQIAEEKDFSSYDGIVVLGGDGSYQEVLQGLTIQTQKSEGVDYNDKNAKLKSLSKPIGIIPTGTGNGVSGWFNGIVDVETAALRIVRGEQHQASVFSVYSDGKLFAICGLLVAYGFFSDMIKKTDEFRWMKRARYPFVILSCMLGKKREFQCSLEYQLALDTPPEESCSSWDQGAEISNDSKWIMHDSGNKPYCGVSVFLAMIEKRGEKMTLDVSSDQVALLIDNGCSTTGLFKYLFKVFKGQEMDPLPANLEVVKKVQGFRFKVTRDNVESDQSVSSSEARNRELEHFMSLDGEAKKRLEVTEVEVRVIPSFSTFYGVYLPEF